MFDHILKREEQYAKQLTDKLILLKGGQKEFFDVFLEEMRAAVATAISADAQATRGMELQDVDIARAALECSIGMWVRVFRLLKSFKEITSYELTRNETNYRLIEVISRMLVKKGEECDAAEAEGQKVLADFYKKSTPPS